MVLHRTLCALVLLVGRALVAFEPSDIASQYADIVVQHNQAIRNIGKGDDSDEQLALAKRTMNGRLVDLLEKARHRDTSLLLSGSDLLALSECAGQLRQTAVAVDLARRATNSVPTEEPYVALLRALCASNRLDDAEQAMHEGMMRYPNADKSYLLPLIIAQKFRASGRLDACMVHYESTLLSLAHRCNRGAVYVDQFARSLEEYCDVARSTAEADDAMHTMETWLRVLRKLKDSYLSSIRYEDNSHLRVEELVQVEALNRALLAVSVYVAPSSMDGEIDGWLMMLSGCSDRRQSYDKWLKQLGVVLDNVQAGLNHSLDGNGITSHLERLRAMLDSDASEDGEHSRFRSAIRERLTTTVEILEQHQRLRQLAGKRLFSDASRTEILNGGRPAFALVHIMDPLSSTAQAMVQNVQYVRVGNAARHDMEVSLCAVQSGIVFDSVKRKCLLVPDLSFEDEAASLSKYSKHLHLSRQIHLLAKSSAEVHSLGAHVFPINVLIDGDGRVLGALTGGEKSTILRLIDMACAASLRARRD